MKIKVRFIWRKYIISDPFLLESLVWSVQQTWPVWSTWLIRIVRSVWLIDLTDLGCNVFIKPQSLIWLPHDWFELAETIGMLSLIWIPHAANSSQLWNNSRGQKWIFHYGNKSYYRIRPVIVGFLVWVPAFWFIVDFRYLSLCLDQFLSISFSVPYWYPLYSGLLRFKVLPYVITSFITLS